MSDTGPPSRTEFLTLTEEPKDTVSRMLIATATVSRPPAIDVALPHRQQPRKLILEPKLEKPITEMELPNRDAARILIELPQEELPHTLSL